MATGFFLDFNHAGQWFVVPVRFRIRWEEYLEMESRVSVPPPLWALPVEDVSGVTFPSFEARRTAIDNQADNEADEGQGLSGPQRVSIRRANPQA